MGLRVVTSFPFFLRRSLWLLPCSPFMARILSGLSFIKTPLQKQGSLRTGQQTFSGEKVAQACNLAAQERTIEGRPSSEIFVHRSGHCPKIRKGGAILSGGFRPRL